MTVNVFRTSIKLLSRHSNLPNAKP